MKVYVLTDEYDGYIKVFHDFDEAKAHAKDLLMNNSVKIDWTKFENGYMKAYIGGTLVAYIHEETL